MRKNIMLIFSIIYILIISFLYLNLFFCFIEIEKCYYLIANPISAVLSITSSFFCIKYLKSSSNINQKTAVTVVIFTALGFLYTLMNLALFISLLIYF